MLTLYHDVTAPAAVVAAMRLQAVADAGGRVRFAGIDTLGLTVAVPPTLDLLEGLRRWAPEARALGLTMRRPSRQPPTLACHLVGELAEESGLGAAWRSRVLAGYWEEDLDIGDERVLTDLAVAAGLSGTAVTGVLADRQLRREASARMAAQRRRGVGGVPVLELDGVLVPAEIPEDDLRRLAML